MYTIAILGASGAVGQEMLKILESRQFPAKEVRLLASPRSAGKKYPYRGKRIQVEAVTEESFKGVDIALFSAGGSITAKWAPIAAKAGAVVVDNTSHYRMDKEVPLIVPEVNGDLVKQKLPKGVIANPNCSTIQMVHALRPLHEKYTIERLVISTYQSVSGKGAKAVNELFEQTEELMEGEKDLTMAEFPHQMAFNVLPHIDVFLDNGYTKEEMKMVNETRKILNAPDIRITATCVRVPVIRAHSEAVNIEFKSAPDVKEVRELLSAEPNVVVIDEPENNHYPLPIYAEGRDETFVGRIRQDISDPSGKTLDMWIVSDNLRKGAALNAVQIAERLVKENIVG